MKARGAGITWLLGILVVLLTCALVVQTAYLVWLHRQLYLALAGPNSGLGELDKLLNVDASGGKASPSSKPSTTDKAGLGQLQGVQEKAERAVSEALKDPALKGLLGDLGIDLPKTPDPSPTQGAFHPTFDFQETDKRYTVSVALPGVKEGDVSATVEKGLLSVTGKRAETRFQELFAFPGPVVPGSESVSFRDGKLVVTVLKAAANGSAA